MLSLQDLCEYLDALLQPALFSDGCPNGLQVEGKREIRKIATGVTASLATIEAAIEAHSDALIVHHGLFWNRDSYTITGSKQKKLKLLLENDISLLAYHLPLDAHRDYGNNWRAAKDLGWEDLEPFGRYGNLSIGVKGTFKPQDRKAFIESLESYYGHTAHCALGGKEIVSRSALVSGGAYKTVLEAAAEGIDCFITGNFDEPAWHMAFEEKINFCALGHSNTEKVGPKSLGEHLQEHFGVPCQFLDCENPF